VVVRLTGFSLNPPLNGS